MKTKFEVDFKELGDILVDVIMARNALANHIIVNNARKDSDIDRAYRLTDTAVNRLNKITDEMSAEIRRQEDEEVAEFIRKTSSPADWQLITSGDRKTSSPADLQPITGSEDPDF